MESTFDTPVQRVGFEVRNGADEDLVVTLTALNDGLVVDSSSFATGLAFTFVAQESVVGFDHVLLDVTGGSGSFLIDKPRFESYVACEAAFLSEGCESGDLSGRQQLGSVGAVTSEIGAAPSNGRYAAMLATEAGDGALWPADCEPRLARTSAAAEARARPREPGLLELGLADGAWVVHYLPDRPGESRRLFTFTLAPGGQTEFEFRLP